MRARRAFMAVASCLVLTAAPAAARDDRAGVLSFESGGGASLLVDWVGRPAGTAFIDSVVVHAGRYAGRLERSPATAGVFASLLTTIPVDFSGDSLELRGWMKYEGVTGYAGLIQRQVARTSTLRFDNMESSHLAGTADWQLLRLTLPLDRRARTVIVGVVLKGPGRVWFDDVQLFVDGKPLATAPVGGLEPAALDTDHEFDGGSNIAIDHLSTVQVANLHTLGKVWGFLKYHDPRVADGRYQWDYELFRVMPAVLAAGDRAAGNRVLSVWVAGLGEAPRCSLCAKSPAGDLLLPRLAWISDAKLLGRDLAARLDRTYDNRVARAEQFYANFRPGGGNPDFENELYYSRDGVPDAGFRLLALYRLWNIVEYWFPYRDVMGEDWDGILREFIPRIVAADSRDAYALTLIALSARMHDGHANLQWSLDVRPPRGPCRLPVALRFVEQRLVVSGYSHPALGPASGLRIGDVIVAIDGQRVDSLVTRWRPLYSASNEPARLQDIAHSIGRGECDSVRLELERNGRRLVLAAGRAPVDSLDQFAGTTHDLPGDTFKRLSRDVAYLKLSSVKQADAEDYVRKSAGAKCLLIDIRNYPSEFMVFALGRHLVSKPTPFARFTSADPSNPGAFTFQPDTVTIQPAPQHFEGRVAILVDESSISSSEFTAMAFRAVPGAIVVGSTTAGADGNASPIPLPGGLGGRMSGMGVYYPDRRPTQRVGIVPDLVVRPTIAGLRAGRDEVLEAAVRRVLGRATTNEERGATRPAP